MNNTHETDKGPATAHPDPTPAQSRQDNKPATAAVNSQLSIEEFLDRDEKKDLLRLLTAGSVDDGKSTLIGRLLFDSKKIYEDQLAALERDSKRMGNAGDHIDYALLCDGLKAEREQGITIDVAYRYFSTNKRKFIIADTPGHEQYTRNMITGGSTANLAIILVDARLGVITQTRRHTFLVSLLGIKHVVLAVNKMDLLDFSEDVFRKSSPTSRPSSVRSASPTSRASPSPPSTATTSSRNPTARRGTTVPASWTTSKPSTSATTTT